MTRCAQSQSAAPTASWPIPGKTCWPTMPASLSDAGTARWKRQCSSNVGQPSAVSRSDSRHSFQTYLEPAPQRFLAQAIDGA